MSERKTRGTKARPRQRADEEKKRPARGTAPAGPGPQSASPAPVVPLLRLVRENPEASALRPLMARQLLALQASHGNQYVQRMVKQSAPSPAAPVQRKPQKGGTGLKSSDFSEHKVRVRLDPYIRKLGKRRVEELKRRYEEQKKKGKISPEVKLGDWLAKQLEKKLAAAAKAVPTATKGPKPDKTAFSDFLDDLKSGTQKAKEYVDYVNKAVDYWNKTGVKPAGLKTAVDDLNKISSTLSSHLGKVGTNISKIKTWYHWLRAVAKVASSTENLDLSKKATLEAWLKSMQALRARTQPLAELAKSTLWKRVMGGSLWAAKASLIGSYILAMWEVSIKAIEAGKNIIEYRVKRIEEATRPEGRKRRRPEPRRPGPWKTAKERRKEEVEAGKVYSRLMEKNRRRRLEEAAKRKFPQYFMRMYMRRYRRIIKRKIEADKRALIGKRVPYSVEFKWAKIVAPKTVDRRQAAREIALFKYLTGDSRCPYFDDVYFGAQKRFIRRKVAGTAKSAGKQQAGGPTIYLPPSPRPRPPMPEPEL